MLCFCVLGVIGGALKSRRAGAVAGGLLGFELGHETSETAAEARFIEREIQQAFLDVGIGFGAAEAVPGGGFGKRVLLKFIEDHDEQIVFERGDAAEAELDVGDVRGPGGG